MRRGQTFIEYMNEVNSSDKHQWISVGDLRPGMILGDEGEWTIKEVFHTEAGTGYTVEETDDVFAFGMFDLIRVVKEEYAF